MSLKGMGPQNSIYEWMISLEMDFHDVGLEHAKHVSRVARKPQIDALMKASWLPSGDGEPFQWKWSLYKSKRKEDRNLSIDEAYARIKDSKK